MHLRNILIPIAVCVLIGGAGCQSHPRKPIDELAHQNEFIRRAPGLEHSSDEISLDGLERAAMIYNASLREKLAAVRLAEADASTAGLWADPSIGFSVERMIKGDGPLWSVGSILSLEVPTSGVPRFQRQLAEARVEAAKSELRAMEWEIRAKLRSAYIEYSQVVAKIQVMDELAGRLSELDSRTKRIAAAGEMTRIAQRMYTAEAAMARTELARMTVELDVMRQRVLEIAGLPPSARISPETTFNFKCVESDRVDPLHPELVMARAEYESSERELELELRMQYPDLMIGAGPRFEGSDRVAMGELGLPLPLWNVNRAGIARALSMREIELVRFEAVFERLQSRAAASLASVSAARTEIETFERDVLPLAEAQLDDVLLMADIAKVDTFMMLEAMRQASSIKLKIIDARAQRAMAIVDLVMNTYQNQGGEP